MKTKAIEPITRFKIKPFFLFLFRAYLSFFSVNSLATDVSSIAEQQRISDGVVIVSLHVLIDGSVGEVKVLESSGNNGLDIAAMERAKKWKFQPATKDGQPVDFWKTIKIELKLEAPAPAENWDVEAARDMSSSQARNYRLLLSKFITKNMKSISIDCYTNRPLFLFDLYVKIESDGKISEKKYSDVSPEAICITRKFSELIWPAPPTSPFVYKVKFSEDRNSKL